MKPNSNIVTGNIGKALIQGNEKFDSVQTNLQDTIAEFNATLTNFGFDVEFQMYELGTRTYDQGSQTLEVVKGIHIICIYFSNIIRASSTRS
jgi:hypothetical protein